MQNTVNNLKKNLIVKILIPVLLFAAVFFTAACKSEGFLFSCPITDGAVYDVKNLAVDVDVYYGDKKCAVSLTNNGKEVVRDDEGKFLIELNDGANLIKVTAFYKKKNEVRTYTVTYKQKVFEINTDITERKIKNGLIEFSAQALCDGEKCPIAVLYGGERISENNGVYACVLKEGDNEFEFVAGSGSLTYVKKESVYLGKFRLNTNLKSMQTDRNVAEFKAIASYDDDICEIKATVGGETIQPVGNKYSYTFPQGGEYEFCLTAVSPTAEYSQYFTITYCAEPPYFDILTIEDGKICKGSVYTFDISVKNGLGQKLPSSAISFAVDFDADDGTENFESLNGGEISQVWNDSVKTSYSLCFNKGKYKKSLGKRTILKITAVYGEKSVSECFNITYAGADSDGKTGKVTLSIEAFTISSGYILKPTSIDVYEGENFATYLCRAIKDNGWDYSYTGKIESGFYLARIEGIDLKGNKIDENLYAKMISAKDTIYKTSISPRDDGKYNLGEFDYTSGSGWMYSVNGVFPNYGFSNYYPQDGDVVRVQFTLCLGKDLGGSDAVGFGSGSYVDKIIDYGKIETLAAEISRNDYFGKGKEFLESILNEIGVWNADEKTIQTAFLRLKEYYAGE